MAVLPTPGSPMSTGLFFVRRERTWMTRRISSSRPMTGSSLPSSASSVRSTAELLQRLELVLGLGVGDAVRSADLGGPPGQQRSRVAPCGAQRVAGRRAVTREREQDVLGRDVLVLELAHLRPDASRRTCDELGRGAGGLAARPQRGQGVERAVELGARSRSHRRRASRARADEPTLRSSSASSRCSGVAWGLRRSWASCRRGLDGLLGLDREAVGLHGQILV